MGETTTTIYIMYKVYYVSLQNMFFFQHFSSLDDFMKKTAWSPTLVASKYPGKETCLRCKNHFFVTGTFVRQNTFIMAHLRLGS